IDILHCLMSLKQTHHPHKTSKHPKAPWKASSKDSPNTHAADPKLHEGAILAQQLFKAQPSDIFICSCPKTGTTWLKALAFTITTPSLTTLPHDCLPFLEKNHHQVHDNVPPVGTHLPYAALPESIRDSDCKIVYIYRNVKDVIVSYYHYLREIVKLLMVDAPFEEAFDEFYDRISYHGPYWDHILGDWKASMERPEKIVFLKYKDLRKNPTSNSKMLADFMGFENLSNLEVNRSGTHYLVDNSNIDNSIYFRKCEDGDWKNYFTDEMKEKIDKLVEL
ncbi:hypothetical protein M8C21_003174, partial [Ambrosia artemisiifolia]